MPYSRDIKPLYKDLVWQRKRAVQNYCHHNYPKSVIVYFNYTNKKGEQKTTPIKRRQTLGEIEKKIITKNGCIIMDELLRKQQLL